MNIPGLLLAALIFLGSGTAPTSDQIRELLPGRWGAVLEIGATRLEGHSIYRADGTVEQSVRIVEGEAVTEMRAAGTWTVEGDTIVVTYTESNAPAFIAVGEVSRDKVTSIDQAQLSYVDEDGSAATEYRVP